MSCKNRTHLSISFTILVGKISIVLRTKFDFPVPNQNSKSVFHSVAKYHTACTTPLSHSFSRKSTRTLTYMLSNLLISSVVFLQ